MPEFLTGLWGRASEQGLWSKAPQGLLGYQPLPPTPAVTSQSGEADTAQKQMDGETVGDAGWVVGSWEKHTQAHPKTLPPVLSEGKV